MLLRQYNDLKTHDEERDIANRALFIRRMCLLLLRHRSDLCPFPILHFVEETSKIALMKEIEIAYWYHLMKTYLKKLDGEARFTTESVRLFFFNTAIFVKKFLYQRQMAEGRTN